MQNEQVPDGINPLDALPPVMDGCATTRRIVKAIDAYLLDLPLTPTPERIYLEMVRVFAQMASPPLNDERSRGQATAFRVARFLGEDSLKTGQGGQCAFEDRRLERTGGPWPVSSSHPETKQTLAAGASIRRRFRNCRSWIASFFSCRT